MKRQQGKIMLDYWRRRHQLISLSSRENAWNLRRFSDALSLISKVFGTNDKHLASLASDEIKQLKMTAHNQRRNWSIYKWGGGQDNIVFD